MALAAAMLGPQAQAAALTAGDEASLITAITTANSNADAGNTITLTANIVITNPAAIPAAGKTITIDNGGFDLTDAGLNAFTVALQGAGDFVFTRTNSFGGSTTLLGSNLLLENGGKLTVGQFDSQNSSTLAIRNAGSVLTASAFNFQANGGASTITIEDGGVLHQAGGTSGSIARASGNTVTILITNPGSRFEADQTLTFSTGLVNATVSDGGWFKANSRLVFGSPTGLSQHSLIVTDAASRLTVNADLGLTRGHIDILNGADATANSITMGGSANAQTSDLLVSDAGSTFTVSGDLNAGTLTGAGNNTAATITLMKGGVLDVGGAARLGGLATRTGQLVIGGKVAAEAAGEFSATSLTLTTGTGTLTFNHTDTDYDFAVPISGGGAINHRAGRTHLTGDSSAFSGATQITGGTLYVDGRLGDAASLLQVSNGGALGGSGRVGGDVIVLAGGVIAPGDSPGTLTIDGDLTLAATSRLDVEFGESGVVGGPLNDLIKVGGLLTLDGVVDVTVTAGGVFDAGLYRIASYGTLDDRGLALGTAPGGGAGISIQTSIPGQVNLVNTGGLPVNFWDGDGAGGSSNGRVDGAGGTWNAANTNWTTATGAVNNAYATGDFLVFAGSPGTVNVGAVDAGSGGLQFAVNGYRLTGGSIGIAGASRVFRVGDGTADGRSYVATIDSPITGNGAAGLNKTDLGTLVLNGANTYGWITNVTAGKLIVNGSMAGGGSGTVVGVNGAIGGSGQIRGGVFNGALAPGGLTTPGTLTIMGPATLGAASRLEYRLGQADTIGGALNDLLVINGNLTLNGTLNVTQSAGGSFLQGVYRLINYTGVLTDNVLDVGSLPTGFTGAIQTSIANQVNLLATGAPPPGPGGGGGGGEEEPPPPPPPPPTFNFWDGDGAADGAISGGDGTWRASPANWTTASGAVNGAYTAEAFAIFAGQGGTVNVDASDGAIAVTGMQFAADGYRLTGDSVTLAAGDNIVRVGDGTAEGAKFVAAIGSALTGSGLLNKEDGGTLILTGANTYSGGTTISGGTLQIGDGGTTGSFQGDVVSNGMLAFKRSNDVTFGGVVSGGGTLAQAGSGVLSLTGDSSAFSGVTEARSGTLAIDGKLGGTTRVLAGARLIGSGQLGGLVNEGVVAPGRGGVGVLTLTGGYAGAGGVLELDATLAGDDAPADRLIVGGATSGVTPIKINRLAGGTGALTRGGILLVQVDGASAEGAFTLAEGDYRRGGENVLVAGAYGYVLRRDAVDGDWRLRSDLEPSAGSSEAPLYQPGVPIYEAYPQALQLLNGLGTMRERTGARQWSGEAGLGVWGRMEAGRTRLQPEDSTTGADLKADRWKLQFGAEPVVAQDGAGGVISAGVTGYLGGVKTKVASPYGGGEIETKGYGLGANLTWIGAGGGYVDAQAQASRFDSDLTSSLLGARADGTRGDGLAASLEAGYGFAAGGLRLTPQAQVSYAKVDFDSFTDAFGAVVASDKSESLIGRVGLGLDYALAAGGGIYAVVDVSHEFGDGTAVDISGVPVVSRVERTWAGLAAGGTYAWGEGRFLVYGEVSGDTSATGFGDSYDIAGTAGFRVRF